MGYGYLEDGSSQSKMFGLGKLLSIRAAAPRHARSWLVCEINEWGSLLTASGLAVGLHFPPANAASLNSKQEGLLDFQPTSRGVAVVINY
jgi:hypothetical protein